MMHRHFSRTAANESTLESTQLGPELTSPFVCALNGHEPIMIKHAAPQHPQALTKLQHRLLYESDSDSSFDLTFSSPSSVGSASEYSDVGYPSSARSRSSTHASRRRATHSSRSESISSVLGSSIAIQRVLMGHNPSSKSQRQSVRAIASAFEQAGRGTHADPPKTLRRQLASVDENAATNAAAVKPQPKPWQQPTNAVPSSRPSAASQSTDTSLTSRRGGANGPLPSRLVISKEPLRGPLSAPAVITAPPSQAFSGAASSEASFVFPPRAGARQPATGTRVRSFISLDGQRDDDEPVFDIIPSPSRKRSLVLSASSSASLAAGRADSGSQPPRSSQASPQEILAPPTPLAAARAPMSGPATALESPSVSPRSRASRDSLVSTYSTDSLGDHPFSLQLSGEASAGASPHFDLGGFPSPCVSGTDRFTLRLDPVALDSSRSSRRGGLQPLVLRSRPSSGSSEATLSASAALTPSMRIDSTTAFPLPPQNLVSRPVQLEKQGLEGMRWPLRQARDLGVESGADDSLAVEQLKREAEALLDSIREVGEELDRAIPPTHRLPGSAFRATHPRSNAASPSDGQAEAEATSFVAVDQAYTDVWRLIDSWYWSSFELGPTSNSA